MKYPLLDEERREYDANENPYRRKKKEKSKNNDK